MKILLNISISIIIILLSMQSRVFAAKLNPIEKNIDNIKIYYAYDNFLPIISLKIAIKNVGTAYIDEDLVGTNSIISYLANNYLFLGKERENFSKKISERNIQFNFTSNIEHFYVSVKFMPQDIKLVTKLLIRFFNDFQISEEDLNKAKQYLKYLKEDAYLNSNTIARLNLKKAFLDKNFSRDGYISDKNYDLIDITSINRWLDLFTDKTRIKLAIVGAFEEESLEKFINQIFEDFSESASIKNKYVESKAFKDKKYKITGYNQMIFYSVIKGIPRSDPNFYKFFIFNYLFGGSGRNSYISEILREEENLTYSGYSYINSFAGSGFLTVYFATEKSNYVKAEKLAKKLLTDIKTHKFTQDELSKAKGYLMGKYDILFSSNASLAGFMLGLILNDLPISYVEDRNNFIKEITLVDINKIRNQIFKKQNFSTVITGDI